MKGIGFLAQAEASAAELRRAMIRNENNAAEVRRVIGTRPRWEGGDCVIENVYDDDKPALDVAPTVGTINQLTETPAACECLECRSARHDREAAGQCHDAEAQAHVEGGEAVPKAVRKPYRDGAGVEQVEAMGIPVHRISTDAAARKKLPIISGVLDYFPDALLAVAEVSRIGNDQHNPGKPLHWAKEKSTDHADCAGRHLIERGTRDTDGGRHTAKAAWRVLAMLQLEIEAERDPNGVIYRDGKAVGRYVDNKWWPL